MSFLFEETPFDVFSLEHFIPILLFAILCYGCIRYANGSLNKQEQSKLGMYLACLPLLGVLSRMTLLLANGTFRLDEDLPLHLCRIIPFISIIVMLNRNRFWLGILYFWIIVGTLNATITPDLHNGFPHYEYFIYFINHVGLLILPLYAVFVYKLNITFRDLIYAFLMTNLFLLSLHGVNYLLGSNYMFTMHKPPVASLFDFLGPWPWYLLNGQFLALGLMFIAYLPFWIRRKIALRKLIKKG